MISFWKKVHVFIQTGEPQYLDRADLEPIFPHGGKAIVCTCGFLEGDSCSLVLEARSFGPYLRGHKWAFPGHWLGEMASQAAGFSAAVQLYQKIGEEATTLNRSMQVKQGDWDSKPLITVVKSDCPIIATCRAEDLNLRYLSGMATYSADVLLEQGESMAKYAGMRVMLSRQ